MTVLSLCVGILLLVTVLVDTFETVVLPRTVTRRVRMTRFFYLTTWGVWSRLARRIRGRDAFLSAFGPLSLLLLFCVWALCLMLSFALIHWGLGSKLTAGAARSDFGIDLYMSGSTFFTLGYGDVTPVTPLTRFIAVTEAGLGFGFLAVVIAYLPVIYQSFSRREVGISLLDARAGSPPTGVELLRRHAQAGTMEGLIDLLREWERWSADVLESHLSYPVLAFYRSQHDRESWLSALTAIMDACALIKMGCEGDPPWRQALIWQSHLTFAMARHTLIDLAITLKVEPLAAEMDRLPAQTFDAVWESLNAAGLSLSREPVKITQLSRLRRQYEPYVNGLSARLMLTLPPFLNTETQADNWQTSAWGETDHFH